MNNKIVLNESQDITSLLSMFPPGEHSWYEVKCNQEIDISLDNFNKDWQNDLSKVLSALANSGGGYLLLGVIENQEGICLDQLGINRKIKGNGTKKWFEDILRTMTEPFIQHLDVYEFSNYNGSKLDKTALYIIEINDSPIAPHQAKDKKYYIRTGSSSLPASHQIVMDILGRKKEPEIIPLFSLDITKKPDVIVFNIVLQNSGSVMAQIVSGFLHIPSFLIPKEKLNTDSTFHKNNVLVFETFISNIDVIGQYPTPILRGMCMYKTIDLRKDVWQLKPRVFLREKFYWQLAADNAPLRSGELSFSDLVIFENGIELKPFGKQENL